MSGNGIANCEDFKRALEHANVERVVLPSGLVVLLCRPPIFAALAMGRVGTELQAKITEAKPEELRAEDIAAFTEWLTDTLQRLFVKPRFTAAPGAHEIGLADILIDDLKFIFRWLRGELFTSEVRGPRSEGRTEDLGSFPPGQAAAFVPGGSGKAQQLPPEPTSGTHGHGGLPVGLHRG